MGSHLAWNCRLPNICSSRASSKALTRHLQPITVSVTKTVSMRDYKLHADAASLYLGARSAAAVLPDMRDVRLILLRCAACIVILDRCEVIALPDPGNPKFLFQPI